MSDAHHRKKQPAVVRRQLLDEAARLCIEQGLAGLKLGAVAREAGVGKGGLLHHFPSKQALLEAPCDEFLASLDRRIARVMAEDPEARGHFARAYLDVMSSYQASDRAQRWAVLSVMLFADPGLRGRWRAWLDQRLAQNSATDSSLSAWIVRLAADGLWLSDMLEGPQADPRGREAVIGELKAMTYRA